jgi:hypothetical protein
MDSIIEFILSKLKLINEDKTRAFLKQLSTGNEYEKRLLICIGIDLKANLVKPDIVQQVFEKIDYNACCKSSNLILHYYEEAIVAIKTFVGSVQNNSQELKLQMSRVMSLNAFATYIYPHFSRDIAINPKVVKSKIIEAELDNVNMPNIGGGIRSLVWTTPLQDLLAIKEDLGKKGEDPATGIVDRLGLMVQDAFKEYIYLEYDLNFNETLFQPCHLSNCWTKESLYISNKYMDGFGRTRQRKGDNINHQMKEVVHYPIVDKKKYKYNIRYLGIIKDFSINISNFVNESMKRYRL